MADSRLEDGMGAAAPGQSPVQAGSVAPGPPPVAARVFGSRLATARAYADLLCGPGIERGLIGPAEASRIWERHLINCALVAELVPTPCLLADIGSGAGLPGIVLAMLLPGAKVVLLEPMARRTLFLQECVTQLGLRNTVVRRARAEEVAGEVRADVVTARAVAGLDRLAELAAGICRPGGLVLAIKGASARQELERALPRLRRLGGGDAEVLKLGMDLVDPPTTVVSFRLLADARSGRRPRDPGRPA